MVGLLDAKDRCGGALQDQLLPSESSPNFQTLLATAKTARVSLGECCQPRASLQFFPARAPDSAAGWREGIVIANACDFCDSY